VKVATLPFLLVMACSQGNDRERVGDEAWHEGRWADAMANYRAAGDSPRLVAKLADAALQSGALSEAAAEWTKLGIDEPTRAGEAAAGLARVAERADHDGKQGALADAILGLRRIAPNWPVGRLASRSSPVPGMQPAQVADLVPALLAGATGRAMAEPLLLTLGQADRARGACEQAVPLLEGVLRRTTEDALRQGATGTLGWCELTLGLTALQAERTGDAERWLDRAAARDPQGAVGRRALVGFGDARARQGDSVSARAAWRMVANGAATPDSTTQLALLRLADVTPAVINDSALSRQVHP